MIAVWRHYNISLKPLYMPEDGTQGLQILWATHGGSLLSGLANDIVFSLIGATVLALWFVGKWLRIGAIVLVILFLGANLEHILYNFTHINLGTVPVALDVTFIQGQMTKSLIKAVIVLLAGAGVAYALLRLPALSRLGGLLILPVLTLPLLLAGSYSFIQPDWMQTHPLLPNISARAAKPNPRIFSDSAFTPSPDPALALADHNVLLIYMEGLSQKSLELGKMRNLTALAEQNLSFTRYLGNQIVTANGLYTTLTGDLPYFLSKKLKWDELRPEDEKARGALPARLRRAGYHTAFLQSAPLGFMNKGKVAPVLGFSETLGRDAWDSHYASDGWGIDDLALFEHALEYVSDLETGQPWFVSLLTTGTHSPYNIPTDFMPDMSSDRYRALAYLDGAIAELMAGLDARGLLNNTVVIFTSDESRENALENPLKDQLILNWLPLIVRHPDKLQAEFGFFVGSQRLPDIIAQLAGPADVLRLAALERTQDPLIMGNSYANRLFWFEQDAKTLLSCDTQSFICARFTDVQDPMSMSIKPPDDTAYYPGLEKLLSKLETPG